MAFIIRNTSSVEDNSLNPPKFFQSNEVQTLINTPKPPCPTFVICCYCCENNCCCKHCKKPYRKKRYFKNNRYRCVCKRKKNMNEHCNCHNKHYPSKKCKCFYTTSDKF